MAGLLALTCWLHSWVSYWQVTKRQVTLDITEGDRKIWSGADMPVNRPVQLQGHTVVVSATVINSNSGDDTSSVTVQFRGKTDLKITSIIATPVPKPGAHTNDSAAS